MSENFNPIQWLVGALLLYGMVIMVYQFVNATIKRNFYIICSWLIGWFYLANGIKSGSEAKAWYRQILGRWMSVVLMNVAFNIALVITEVTRNIISTAFDNTTISGFDYLDDDIGDFKVMTNLVLLFTIEAIFQVAFQYTEKTVEAIWSVRDDEKFNRTRSVAGSEAIHMAENAISTSGDAFDRL
jgi:hypothetical protein